HSININHTRHGIKIHGHHWQPPILARRPIHPAAPVAILYLYLSPINKTGLHSTQHRQLPTNLCTFFLCANRHPNHFTRSTTHKPSVPDFFPASPLSPCFNPPSDLPHTMIL